MKVRGSWRTQEKLWRDLGRKGEPVPTPQRSPVELAHATLARAKEHGGISPRTMRQLEQDVEREKRKALMKKQNPQRFKQATTIQTLLFPKGSYTPASARAWALRAGLKAPKVDEGSEKATKLRVRQLPPARFKPSTFRTIQLGEHVEAVIGVLKPSGSGVHANPSVQVRSSSGSFNVHAATRHEAERVAERMRKEHSRRGIKARVSVKRNPHPGQRVWKLAASSWGRAAGYPVTVPFKPTHFDGAWDYSGPVWDRTEKQKSGGVWATFTKEGKQTYQGDSTPVYRLEGS